MKTNVMIFRSFKALGFALILFLAMALFASPLRAQTVDDFRRGEVLVEINPGASIDAINARYGTSTIQRIYGTNFYRLGTPKQKKEVKFRKRLSKDPDVLSATLNPLITTPVNVLGRAVIGFPGDHPTTGQIKSRYLAQQLVGDLQALQLRAKGNGVLVAVVDTGIDRNHPDIKDHLWTDPGEIPADHVDNDNDGLVDDVFGWNFFDSSEDTMELRGNPQTSIAGHGTFIAGLIALIAPSAKIMPIRAFSADGVSDAFSVAQGIKYAVDHGARVINLSFGSTEDSPVMHDAVTYAHQRGVLMIAAAGNENKGDDVAPQFPAKWNLEVMGVVALEADNRKATFSNFGTSVSVSATGVDLFSLYPELNSTPDYAMWSGTSFAAPLATATAALILQDNPHQDIRGTIEATSANIDAQNIGFEGKLGRGRVDPLAALQSLQSTGGSRGEIELLPTGLEPAAHGKAEATVSGTKHEFEIEAEGTAPRSIYKIVVNGTVILDGTRLDDVNHYRAWASNFGNFKIEFSTSPSGDQLPLPAGINPVTSIKRVEVRDSQDRVIIANTFGAPAPGETPNQSVEKEATLAPTAVLPDAKGRARAESEPEREKLRVEGEKLTSGVSYLIVVDGVSLGSFQAQSGFFAVEFTSDGSSGFVLPQSLRPITKLQRVELHDPLGQIVLQGSFQAGGDDFGGDDSGGGETTFQGVIESLPSGGLIGDWRVAGHTVHISASTELRQDKGPAVVGAQVEVRGTSEPDGSTNATRVEVLSSGGQIGETSFQGAIQSMPSSGFVGDWRVAGVIVHVFSSTEIRQDKGSAAVGAQVEVKGTAQPDGSNNASRVEVLSGVSGGQEVTRQANLNATSFDPDAKGKVTTKMSSSRQTLEIEASKLDGNSTYTVVVDGFSLETVTTDGSGSFKISLSTEDGSLPEQVKPVSNIQHVNVIDSQSRTVLTSGPFV
jgi:subtilisin family serine protease